MLRAQAQMLVQRSKDLGKLRLRPGICAILLPGSLECSELTVLANSARHICIAYAIGSEATHYARRSTPAKMRSIVQSMD